MKNSYIDNMTAAQQEAIQRLNPQSGASVGIAMQMGLAHNARNQAPAQETEIDEDGVRALPQDRLDSTIAQHNKLIEKIKADTSGRELTSREESRLSDLQESLVVFNAEDERRRQPAGRKTTVDVRGSVAFPDAPKGPQAPSPAAAARNGVIFNAGARDFSARLFGAAPRAEAGEADNFFNALATRTFDPRMAVATEGVGTDGGFAVPQIWYRGMIDQALQVSEFAQRCRIFPAESNNLTIPMLDTRNRQSGVAGLIARWSAEAELQTPQVMKWTAVEMKLKKTFVLSEASSELVEDGINYAQQLTEGMSLATAQTIDAAILFGTGVGMPLGIINSPGAIEIAKDVSQAADSLSFTNLVAMYSRLSPACQKRAEWFVTPDALPMLLTIKVPGTEVLAFLSGGPNDAAAGKPAGTIFGRPVIVTEIASQLSDKGDIVFADMSQYALLMKKSARMENSIAPRFNSDVVSFRMIMRVDGTPLWPTAITPYNGGAKQTWATYLAERA